MHCTDLCARAVYVASHACVLACVLACVAGRAHCPGVWAVWMGILRRVPGSVLWLMTPTQSVASTRQLLQLLREARAAGVHPSRIHFAPRCDSLWGAGQQPQFLHPYLVNHNVSVCDLHTLGRFVVSPTKESSSQM